MKVSILASTNPGYKLTKDEALKFGGKSAGICYMPDDIEALFSEPEEKTIRRANMTLNSGHHSVFDHTSYNLALEGIPENKLINKTKVADFDILNSLFVIGYNIFPIISTNPYAISNEDIIKNGSNVGKISLIHNLVAYIMLFFKIK